MKSEGCWMGGVLSQILVQSFLAHGDRKIVHPIPDTFSVCKQRNYVEIKKL
jgi:hypothetical protein